VGVLRAGRLVVAVDRAVGVSPADLAAAWDADAEARDAGLAAVEAPRPGEFLGDVLALVVIPLAVNLGSSAACALVSKVVAALRPARPDAADLEVVATAGGDGGLVVVVRIAGQRR
jgi:hypothetical protein